MEWRRDEAAAWRASDERLPDGARADGGGLNPAASNPPLYYLPEAAAYAAFRDTRIFTRLWVMRAVSALWIVGTIVGVWLLAGELFTKDRRSQVAAAGLAAFAPMVQFLSASVTPDSALFAVWSIALWLGVRVVRRGLTRVNAAGFGAAVGIALAIKATSYALLPAVLVAVAFGLRRTRTPRGGLLGLLTIAGTFALTSGAWYVAAAALDRPAAAQVGFLTTAPDLNLREFASYLWQYYLPKLPFLTPYPSVAETLPAYDLLMKGSWGAFGWLEVQFPDWVYLSLTAATCVVSAMVGVAAWRARAQLPFGVIAFLGVAILSLIGGLHYTDFRQLEGGASNFIQGRYLLPLVGVAGAAFAVALRLLPTRVSSVVLGFVLSALVTLDLASLGITLERFHG